MIINVELLKEFEDAQFFNAIPFPWFCFQQYVRNEAFERLAAEFPAAKIFEWHQDLPRDHGQRSHDRYYLAYERSIYHHGECRSGIVKHSELSATWQQFVEELQNEPHLDFLRRLLGVVNIQLRFAWHIGINGSEVSPHQDAGGKIGTLLFYFNTGEDWQSNWGGETLLFERKIVSTGNPDFGDFLQSVIGGRPNEDQCLLFKNTENAWHGVRKLIVPPEAQRRIFNVIVEFA